LFRYFPPRHYRVLYMMEPSFVTSWGGPM
jgi:hypothetical protein